MNKICRWRLLLWAGFLAATSPAAPPNVVIFIADDLSWHDVACFGGPTDAKTPNLDQLATQGMKLTGFFSPASVCSPSRQALLTGLYPVRNGAYPNHAMVRPGTKSMPAYLKELDYRTACIGKTHFAPRSAYPFDTFMGMLGEDAAAGKGEDAGDGDLDTAAAEKFVRQAADKPFCLYVATHEPHAPWTKGDASKFPPETLKLPPYMVDTPETRKALSAYYAEVAVMDAQVGAIMRLLANTGHAQDTLFLFFSEQGSSMPHGKWTCYDVGIRVAAIARWPGHIAAGAQSAALMQYVDVLPTILAAAGAKVPASPADIDGRSFLPVLLGQAAQHRDYVYAEHTARGIIKGPEAYGTRAVRDNRWKLIVNLNAASEFSNAISNGDVIKSWATKGAAGDAFAKQQVDRYTRRPAVELYDLQSDPWELNDVAALPENREVVARLQTSLQAWMQQQGDEGDKTERDANEHQVGKHNPASSGTTDPAAAKGSETGKAGTKSEGKRDRKP